MTLQEVVTQAAVAQPKEHSHVVIALWLFVAMTVILAFALWVTIKARGGWAYVATIPMTNLRSLAAIVLFVLTIVGSGLVGYLAGVWPPEYVYDTTMYVLTIWAGIEVAGVWIKRATTNANIPSTQNMMAAQAASGVTVDSRTARDVAAPTARQAIPGQTVEMPVVVMPPVNARPVVNEPPVVPPQVIPNAVPSD